MKKNIVLSIVIALALVLTLGASKLLADGGNVKVILKDSKGNGINDADVFYYDSGWQLMGQTGDNGNGTLESVVPKTTDIELRGEAGKFKWKNVVASSEPILEITTIEVMVKLETCSGSPLTGEAYRYYDGWKSIGNTEATIELLPYYDEATTTKNWYDFQVKYDYRTSATIRRYIADDPEVVFTTTKVTLFGSDVLWYNNGGFRSFTSPKEVIGGEGKWADFKFDGSRSPTVRLDIKGCSLSGAMITLVDEAGNPLANYPKDYATEKRNLAYKYRNGGSWASSTSFQTDANGKTFCNITGSGWDNKITVTLNQTSKEQNVTMNSTFQAAKVNANLKTCTGPITASPGGTLAQGGGYWYTHGTTGPSGTVTFYTFPTSPGTIKLIMTYNHASETQYPPIATGTNEVDFTATEVTFNYPGDIKSNKGGSWWMFTKPTMNLLAGDYNFWFKTGASWTGPVAINVSECKMGGWPMLVHFEESDGTPIEGDKAWYSDYYIPGGLQDAGMSDKNGDIFVLVPDGNHKGRLDLVKGEDKTYDENRNHTVDLSVNPVVTFKTVKVTVKLQDHDLDGTTDDLSQKEAYDLYVDAYGGSRQKFGSGTTTNYQENMELLPSNYKYSFEMRYEGVKEFVRDVQITPSNNTVTFSTGQVTYGTGTVVVKYDSYSQSPNNLPFTDYMDMITNNYTLKFYDASNKLVYQGDVLAGKLLDLRDGSYGTPKSIPKAAPGQPAEDVEIVQIPTEFALSQNYPNPFNPATTISYQLPEDTEVTLTIYNMMGQKIRTFVSGSMKAGYYNVVWNGANDQGQLVANGVYIYHIKAGTFTEIKRMVFLK